MIGVTNQELSSGQNVTCTVDGVQVKVYECHNTGDIVVDIYVGELPVACLYKGTYIKKLVSFKYACDANEIEREVK